MDDTTVETIVDDLESELVTDRERYEAVDYADLSDVVVPKADRSTDIGLGHLALGNCERGREWLATAASASFRWFDVGVEQALDFEQPVGPDRFTRLRLALLDALIAADEPTLEGLLGDVTVRLEDVPQDRREGPRHWAAYCEALVAIARDGDSDSEEAVERLRAVADDGGSDWGHVRATVLEAIVTGDADAVREGLETLLEYHRETNVGDTEVPELRQHVSLDACGLLVLARRHGLDVDVESEYVPACVSKGG